MMYAFAAMMGWCGTTWPGWWRHPDPGPDPWWLIGGIIGAVGGIVAWVVLGPQVAPDGGLIAMALISFFGGNFLGTVAGGLRGMAGRTSAARVD